MRQAIVLAMPALFFEKCAVYINKEEKHIKKILHKKVRKTIAIFFEARYSVTCP